MNSTETLRLNGRVRETLQYRRENRDISTRERDAWSYFESPIEAYESEFGLSRGYFRQHVLNRRTQGLESLALDFASEGHALRGLQYLSGGLSVGLSDSRTDLNKEYDNSHNLGNISGDALSKRTWKKVDAWLRSIQSNQDKFDLILCRPEGGLYRIPDLGIFHFFVLQNMYQMLDNNNGELYSQVSHWIRDGWYFGRWMNLLDKTKGIEAEFNSGGNVLSIKKHINAPQLLPALS